MQLLKQGFGGVTSDALKTVKTLEVEELLQDEYLAASGRDSLLKTLAIPSTFYNKQPEQLQMNMVRSQKVALKEKSEELVVFERNGKGLFVTQRKDYEVLDPAEHLGIDLTKNSLLSYEDFGRGTMRYCMSHTDVGQMNKGEFEPGLFIEYPIFYNTDMKVQFGLLRLVCMNGMIDTQLMQDLKFKLQKTDKDLLPVIIEGLITAQRKLVPQYNDFKEFTHNRTLTRPEIEDLLFIAVDKKFITPNLRVLALKHLSQLDSGVEVDIVSPQRVRNCEDYMNLITFYAQKSRSTYSRVQSESGVYKQLFNLYNKEATPIVAPVAEINDILNKYDKN
jgi:hypothetical protein